MARSRATDLSRDPVIVFWELTRACALACRHCRADAQPRRDALELTTEQCYRVLDDLAGFDQPPIVVLTGGDPFMRRDLLDLVGYGVHAGLHVSLSPSVTPLVTRERLRQARAAGVMAISFSLDGSSPEIHDRFRGVAGSFERTLQTIVMARSEGLKVQVNTTVSRYNRHDLPAIAALLNDLGIRVWSVFFLVPTGRGMEDDVLTAPEHEAVYRWLDDLAHDAPFMIKTTAGQPFRRVRLMSQLRAAGRDRRSLSPAEIMAEWEGGAPTNEGKGVFFISHRGDIYPSGFLPLRAGNVRTDSVVDCYREAELFQALRDTARLRGKCGRCPFREVCGGCRARAYGLTGDYLAADPTCAFEPPPS